MAYLGFQIEGARIFGRLWTDDPGGNVGGSPNGILTQFVSSDGGMEDDKRGRGTDEGGIPFPSKILTFTHISYSL